MSDAIVSLIRTWVPVGVGAALSWLLTLGVELDPDAQAGLIAGLTGVVIATYYGLVRLLERKWPVFGVFLGTRRQPEYGKPEDAAVSPAVALSRRAAHAPDEMGG